MPIDYAIWEIWQENMPLPEDEEFVNKFQLREQTFRKGNLKAMIYCVVESSYTINRLKYMDSLKEHIFENNIWIKPDYYSTKTVSSPGFFTLLHPRFTNKAQLVLDLKKAISQIKVNKDDEDVREWYEKRNVSLHEENNLIPQFHVETSLRKWGKIHVETIIVQCSDDDAKYMKFLLSEAGTQKNTTKDFLFLPE